MGLVVRVIGYTAFIGVPDELLPEGGKHTAAAQDEGSIMARLTECAGRTCYDSYGRGRSSAEYHQHILQVGHGSVLEHASISFYIEGVSRGLTHELVRHRAGTAISQRSTRYVDESESAWAWHPLIAEALEARGIIQPQDERGDRLREHAGALYGEIVLMVQSYLEGLGTDKLTARKQARGAARGALGNALETSLVWTANIRALRNVIEQRASEFADAEIRLLGNALLEAALTVCPEYFSDYERVSCPDGIGFGVTTQFRKV